MKAILKTLTPVHIGNGVTYNKGIDFIQKGGKIAIVDEKKVLQLIGEKNIDQWVAAIERYNPDTDFQKQPLLELLKSRGFSNIELNQLSSRISNLKSVENRSSQLKEHFRTSMQGMAIPGSSLKGALKTIILDYLIEEDRYKFDVNDLKFEKQDWKTKSTVNEWRFDNIESELFGQNANEKSTRFLHVGDIHFPDIQSEIHEIKILNLQYEEWEFKEGQHFLAETIPAGRQTEFQWKLNRESLERNKNKYPGIWRVEKIDFLSGSITDFCSIIWERSRSLVDWEIDILKEQPLNEEGELMHRRYQKLLEKFDQCEENEFIVRVGANSGWVFMTAGWWRRFKDDFKKDDWASLRKSIQKKDYPEDMIWPKTRKISAEGQIFGFVKVALFD